MLEHSCSLLDDYGRADTIKNMVRTEHLRLVEGTGGREMQDASRRISTVGELQSVETPKVSHDLPKDRRGSNSEET